MSDLTENIRREMVAEINADPHSRSALEAQHGKVWDTGELSAEFEVTGFMAPFVVVNRKLDGKTGSMMFQHNPRYYFEFTEDNS